MASLNQAKSAALDDCRYMAKTLAISMQDLTPEERDDVLQVLSAELRRLAESADDEFTSHESGPLDTASQDTSHRPCTPTKLAC